MKPWVEWLLSIGLLLLVVSVIVALVIGFVRWFRPKTRADSKLEEDEGVNGADFDLGTPDQSTLFLRRKWRNREVRKYTGTSLAGELFKIAVYPKQSKIDYSYVNSCETIVGQMTYTVQPKSRMIYDLVDSRHHFSMAIEKPGHGLLLFASDTDDAAAIVCVIALPEPCSATGAATGVATGITGVATAPNDMPICESVPIGIFGYMHVSNDLERSQVGFIASQESTRATGSTPSGVSSDHHVLELQSFAPFPLNHGEPSMRETYGCRVFGATGIELSDFKTHDASDKSYLTCRTTYNDDETPANVFMSGESWFASSEKEKPVGVTLNGSAILMLPQLFSEDLPFPTHAHFLAVFMRQQHSEQRSAASVTLATVEIHASSNSIKIFSETQIFFNGTLVPIASCPELYDPKLVDPGIKLVDPCLGTFVAKHEEEMVVAQFYREWCFLTGKLHQDTAFLAFALAR